MKTRSLRWTIPFAALLALAGPAWSQVEEQDDDAAAPPAQQDQGGSLDELLGLEEDDGAQSARETAEAQAEAELDRALTERAIADAFRAALEKMTISADLLGDQFDSGLATQRVQEEILAKLDELLDNARKQQSNSSSSSSSSSSQQQQQQQQSGMNQQPRPGQQNPQQSQADPSQNPNPSESTAGDRTPEQREGELNSILEETGVEWGALPPRIRDQLIQGSKDKASALYRRLTEEYYRRLAEEASN